MVSFGNTKGLDELVLMILILGLHEKVPMPFAINGSVSMLQINVSLKGRCISGLSFTITVLVKVFSQPLLLVTNNCTFTVPGEVYR
jgi:hypothetical protein